MERERCHVIIYDDVRESIQGVYERCLDFIGVEQDGRTKFTARRTSRGYRLNWVQRLNYNPPRTILQFAKTVENRARARRKSAGGKPEKSALWKLRRRVRDWNSVEAPFKKLSPAMRRTLCETFEAEKNKL